MREMKLSVAGWVLLGVAMLVSAAVSYSMLQADYRMARLQHIAAGPGLSEFGGTYAFLAFVIAALFVAGSLCVLWGRSSERVSRRTG